MGDAEVKDGVIEEEESPASEEEETQEGDEAQEGDESSAGEVEQEEEVNVKEALKQTREENNHLKRTIDFLQNTMSRPVQQAQTKRIEIDPDEPIQGSKLLEVLDARDAKVKADAQNLRLTTLETVAKEKHKDYDTVALDYFKQIAAQNPGMYETVMASANPPEIAYRIGQTHPSYLANVQKRAAVTTAKKVITNSKKVPTLAEGSGKKTIQSKTGAPDYDKMSDAEFDAYVEKVKARQYK